MKHGGRVSHGPVKDSYFCGAYPDPDADPGGSKKFFFNDFIAQAHLSYDELSIYAVWSGSG